MEYKKYIKVKIDWLGVTVHVYFVNDVVKWRNENLLEKFPKIPKMIYSEAYALHTYIPEYQFDHFITFNEKAHWGVIAHECFHCVKSMLEHNDITDEETTAHMLEYLIAKIQNKLEK